MSSSAARRDAGSRQESMLLCHLFAAHLRQFYGNPIC